MDSPSSTDNSTFRSESSLVKAILVENQNDLLRFNSLVMIQAILNNIFLHPAEDKYRKLKLSNQKLKDNVLSVKGGLELLTFLGFKKVDDFLILERKCLKCEICEKVAKELVLLKECMLSIDHFLFKEYGNVSDTPTEEELIKAKKKTLEESKKKKEQQLKNLEEKEKIKKKIEMDQKERKINSKDTNYVCQRPKLKGGKITTFRDVGIDLNQGGG